MGAAALPTSQPSSSPRTTAPRDLARSCPRTSRADPSAAGVRAIAAFAALVLGMVLARAGSVEPAALWFSVASGAAAVAAATTHRACALSLWIACLFLGGGVYAWRVDERSGTTLDAVLGVSDPDSGHPAAWLVERVVTVEGEILASPRVLAPPGGIFARFAWREPGISIPIRADRVIGAQDQAPATGKLDLERLQLWRSAGWRLLGVAPRCHTG